MGLLRCVRVFGYHRNSNVNAVPLIVVVKLGNVLLCLRRNNPAPDSQAVREDSYRTNGNRRFHTRCERLPSTTTRVKSRWVVKMIHHFLTRM